jgi:hypothetical protein
LIIGAPGCTDSSAGAPSSTFRQNVDATAGAAGRNAKKAAGKNNQVRSFMVPSQ